MEYLFHGQHHLILRLSGLRQLETLYLFWPNSILLLIKPNFGLPLLSCLVVSGIDDEVIFPLDLRPLF